ncbi:hypothetical protein HNQ51_003440 [Inhella inkyongensis]|uniref:DUF1289 domain-containing protein n=1 Tax=Inhella inkyongensis TaxID=392593 RepID=A0A840S491_9BURK|nr:DUF1289 domain-containing protein [Inhella inkyongensis]MBB5206097.1 hypothetical protein [Inhella inkyongensis]
MKPDPLPSPCIQLCKIDAQTQLCLGCARRLDEIAGWGQASEDFKRLVWAQLPARRKQLGLPPLTLSREAAP